MRWEIALAGQGPREIIHWPEEADYGQIAKVRGGNPILFPFAARSFDRGQIGFWRPARDRRLPMPMHGFARDGQFRLDACDDNGFTAILEPGAVAREAYPFDYTFAVRYTFSELAMTVEFLLDNHGDSPLPWSAGHHFYFNLPWRPGTTRKDYAVAIPAKKAFRQAADGTLVAVKDFTNLTDFADPGIVDLIHCRLTSPACRLGSKNGEEAITITIGDGEMPSAWTAITTWTQAADSPFYCVEPWMGPPNSPETKKGLHVVEPGGQGRFKVEVSLL